MTLKNVYQAIQLGFDFTPLNDLPFEPTNQLPGSEGKIEELRERLNKGLPLWHPDDATYVGITGGDHVPMRQHSKSFSNYVR